MQFSCIVFDTAPTGHTLRFLSFPTVLEKALSKLSGLSGRFGPMMNQVRALVLSILCTTDMRTQMSSMMGAGVNTSEIFEKLESMRTVVTEVNTQFKNPVRHRFLRFLSSALTIVAGIDDFYPRHEFVLSSSPTIPH